MATANNKRRCTIINIFEQPSTDKVPIVSFERQADYDDDVSGG